MSNCRKARLKGERIGKSILVANVFRVKNNLLFHFQSHDFGFPLQYCSCVKLEAFTFAQRPPPGFYASLYGLS